MEYFFNVNTGRVEQRPVEQNFYPGTNVPIKSMAEIAANQNVVLPNQTSFDPSSIQSIFPSNFPTGITASSAAIPFGSPIDIQQGFTRNTPSDQGTNFEFLPSANEADEIDEVKERKGGIAELFAFLANFIPGVGLLKKLGESSGIRSLNQRIQQSDFGRSKNLMDYLDIKSYGGYDEREAAKRATIEDAARITSGLKRTAADDVIDRGRGQISTRTTSAPRRSSSTYSAANRAFARDR